MFFEERYEPQEASALYANYRSSEYFNVRHQFEPWYSRSLNDGLGGEADLAARRGKYRELVSEFNSDQVVESVLDYGGDRGQLLVGGPGTSHYVFDISGVATEPGVISIRDAEALAKQRFDLVTLCEVLEHVSAPQDTLAEVLRLVKPGGLLFITVPNREFPIADIPTGSWYRSYLKTILKSRLATLLVDFWSTGWKVKFKRIPPLGFAKMHEHINFFDVSSLQTALKTLGLDVLACQTFGEDRCLAALCRAPAQRN
jgi:SAM-dependent methyltransferase